MTKKDKKDNIIYLNNKIDPKVQELLTLAKNIDTLIIDSFDLGMSHFEIMGILANRLGECLRTAPNKAEDVDVLIEILLKKADLCQS